MRRTVAGAIVELAFRRYLSQQDIPFDITAATPFTDPAGMMFRSAVIAVT